MVDIRGHEIAQVIRERLEEIREWAELKLDLLYDIGAILISLGYIKDVPTLTVVGKNLFVLPERLRYWILGRIGALGTTEEIQKMFDYIGKLLEELCSGLEEVAQVVERKSQITDGDIIKVLKTVDRIITILPSPRRE